MTTTIFVVSALVMLVFLLRAVRGQQIAVSTPADLAGQTRPVDLEAFRNLVSPDEEEFLRAHLLPGEFHSVQRERLRAAMEYIRCAAHNATILLRLGEAARRSTDLKVAEAGQQLVDSALRLRLYALLSMTRLYAGIMFPGAHLSAGRLLESYEQLGALATKLAFIQNPGRASGLSAVL